MSQQFFIECHQVFSTDGIIYFIFSSQLPIECDKIFVILPIECDKMCRRCALFCGEGGVGEGGVEASHFGGEGVDVVIGDFVAAGLAKLRFF